jgi:hypothetical protein
MTKRQKDTKFSHGVPMRFLFSFLPFKREGYKFVSDSEAATFSEAESPCRKS